MIFLEYENLFGYAPLCNERAAGSVFFNFQSVSGGGLHG